MLHSSSSPLAGRTIILQSVDPQFDGAEYHVEDWWDRVVGKSWTVMHGNPACLNYAYRCGSNGFALDDEVLYGKIGPFGHLVHISEVLVPEVKE